MEGGAQLQSAAGSARQNLAHARRARKRAAAIDRLSGLPQAGHGTVSHVGGIGRRTVRSHAFTRMSSENSKPAILIIVENLPVPPDRRVWQECLTLRDAGYKVVVVSPKMKS